jgi:hypothetical protein
MPVNVSLTLSTLASALVTPLVVALWARITPVAARSEFDHLTAASLRARNKWLDHCFTFFMFVGLLVPFAFITSLSSERLAPWLVGVAIGNMVVVPTGVIAAITLPKGTVRFREFWCFYEVRWGIGLRGIAWVYGAIAILWTFCAARLCLGT